MSDEQQEGTQAIEPYVRKDLKVLKEFVLDLDGKYSLYDYPDLLDLWSLIDPAWFWSDHSTRRFRLSYLWCPLPEDPSVSEDEAKTKMLSWEEIDGVVLKSVMDSCLAKGWSMEITSEGALYGEKFQSAPDFSPGMNGTRVADPPSR